ncbi:2-oxoglutarate and iron-dependent oxygenase domain-containing protein 3 isoform X2 [Phacochoerus africanus]|uniref:2-oxoglutarate and iron-dependent oxygenase domain-containing protein 3 isoform X2 n=1 Tax=Phacochoerus africanus TaxID=41426 RepID=UPI001FD8F06C|nr:2-oxoglutarate and iron-dependent oxygenase domain-containing protein 3 isoform X2 [Phacochoerus africanus]
MAPQRRGAPKGPEGCGAAERGRPNSTKGVRAPRDVRRKWLRAAVLGACTTLAGLLLWGRLGADEDGITEVLAGRSEVLPGRFIEVPCSEDYDSQRRFEGCTPRKCGRGVSDAVITRDEARRIRSIAEKGLSLGGSDGGASILDLHSGALSVGKHFVNLYRYFGDKIQNIFSEEDFRLYRAGVGPKFLEPQQERAAEGPAGDRPGVWHQRVLAAPDQAHLLLPHQQHGGPDGARRVLARARGQGDLRLLRLYLAALPLRLPGRLRRGAVCVHGGRGQPDGGAQSRPRVLLHLGV